MPSDLMGERGSVLRGRRNQPPPMPKETGGLTKVKNVSHVLQSIGSHDFKPGEIIEIEDELAKVLIQLPYFRYPPPEETNIQCSKTKELRHAMWPDPVSEQWVHEFNRDIFPCQTDEFDQAKKSDDQFSIVFRIMQLNELSGGNRVVLRLAGYLARRGHGVTVSVQAGPVDASAFDGIPISLHCGQGIPDAEFIVGTYWSTIHNVITSGLTGTRIGLIQGDEPSWPGCQNKDAAIGAFSDPSVNYMAVSPSLADICREKYGTPNITHLPGNGVCIYDFSPRINSFDKRNGVCFIHRGVWWKGDADAVEAVSLVRGKLSEVNAQAAGFKAWGSSGIKYHQSPTVEQMAMMYSTSDFYLSFSQFEGSPLPPLEAMACGCIPIVTPIGVSEYLEDRDNGFIVNGGPPEAAALMLSVLNDDELRLKLIRNGLITARDRPWSMVCSAFEDALVKLQTHHGLHHSGGL